MSEAGPGGPVGLVADLAVERGDRRFEIDVDVAPGQATAIVGPNGSGKSTIVDALAGLLPLARGRIVMTGTVPRTLADTDTGVALAPRQRRLGISFQDQRLFPHLSVLENVAFGLRASGCSRTDAREQALRWLDRLGLADVAGRHPPVLSGGQRQRVGLARALAADADALILDEPLSAVDAQSRARLITLLRDHLRVSGRAGLIVTHSFAEASALASSVVVLESGRITQRGTPAEVERAPRTAYVERLVAGFGAEAAPDAATGDAPPR